MPQERWRTLDSMEDTGSQAMLLGRLLETPLEKACGVSTTRLKREESFKTVLKRIYLRSSY